MKSNSQKGIKISVTIISLVSVALIMLLWEKTPLISSLVPPETLDVISTDTVKFTHDTHLKGYKKPSPNGHQSTGNTLGHQPVAEAGHVHDVHSVNSSRLPTSLLEPRKDDKDLTKLPAQETGCNYARGKWVADKKRPLYSGFECKQWLSSMWSCRLMHRKDFSYESFRWQPKGCDMPEFKGSEFLKRMQGKTIALVGDSLGRQQFQSLMCMVTGGKENSEVEDVGLEYGLVQEPGATRPAGWAYRFPSTNTTILYYWSASLCELEPLNPADPATNYAMHLDRPVPFLKHYLHKLDVVVLNTGHHWNRGKFNANRWVMYASGKPVKDRKLAMMMNAKNLTIYSVVKWLDSQIPQYPHLKAFFRTISPRHFVNGEWNTGGSCDNTTPLTVGSEVLQDRSSDPGAEGAVKGTKVKLLDITALSELRNEGHISKYGSKANAGVQDCLHWCLPGIPDTWNEILSAQL
ncbi:putative PMR5 domain, PC-Esterase [Dioscorea sansibarensis]